MMTGVGVILGTAAYMAPEQARGRTWTDARAISGRLAPSCHEMLTGARAFGQSVVETLGAVT